MEMKRITTEGTLVGGHKGPAVEIQFDPSREWGTEEVALEAGRSGHLVEVDLNGVRFRSAIVSRMSRLFVVVDEALARRAGATVGDKVRVTVWPASTMPSAASKPAPPKAPPKKRR
jgi:uncharacterized protein DUF1905